MTSVPPPLSVSMSWRGRLLALAIVLPMAAVGLWLEHPWQRPARTVQPTPCWLPVYLSSSNTGGFLAVPGYAFYPAPGSAFVGAAKGADKHWGYNAAIGFLPVDQRMISPDGKWWVYATPLHPSISAAFHLVDRHGSDRTVWTGSGRAFPLGWTAGGAVFVHVGPSPQYQTEYLQIDPATGNLRSLTAIAGDPVGTDASGLWGIRNQVTGLESDNNPPIHSIVSRTDYSTGATVTWWDQTIPGLAFVLGFDKDGRPILGITAIPGRYVLLTSPNSEAEITGDAHAADFVPVSAVGDAHGVWFGDFHGAVWLWKAGEGLKRVAQLPTHAPDSGSDSAIIAGPCR
jgi:hypothetical protein